MTAAYLMLAHDNLAVAGEVAGALAADGRTVAAHIAARAGASDVAALSRRLLGDESERVPQPYILLRHLISETGHAVLDRMVERGTPDAETLTDLYQSFAVRPTLLDLRDRLGIDKTTAILLEQRFEEDLENIAKLPRVEVL